MTYSLNPVFQKINYTAREEGFYPISPNNGISQKILSVFKWALRPFISLYSLISNKLQTGRFLTTNRVIVSDMGSPMMKCWKTLACYQDLKSEVQEKMWSMKPHITLIHVGCLKSIPHSTILAIGRTKAGLPFSIFFDAQGTKPSQAKIINSMESGSWGGKSVSELYSDLMGDTIFPKPELIYSQSNIQADFVSCTAYSSVFQQKLKHAFLKENFSPESFMQGIANHQTISFFEARRVVSKLAKSL